MKDEALKCCNEPNIAQRGTYGSPLFIYHCSNCGLEMWNPVTEDKLDKEWSKLIMELKNEKLSKL